VELFELHLTKGEENMVFAGEVIEKGAFAYVGGIGDVLDGSLNKAFPGKEIKGSTEEAFAKFGAMTLAAVGGRGWTQEVFAGDGF
jgi:hypothetical protein